MPDSVAVRHSYGNALASLPGRFTEARTHRGHALAADSSFELARQNLGRLEQMGR